MTLLKSKLTAAPLFLQIAPLVYVFLASAKSTYIGAISAGCAGRPNGKPRPISLTCSVVTPVVASKGVYTTPGATPLMRIPFPWVVVSKTNVATDNRRSNHNDPGRALTCKRRSYLPDETSKGALACGVVIVAYAWRKHNIRDGEYDGRAWRHLRDGRASQEETCVYIGAHDLVELLGGVCGNVGIDDTDVSANNLVNDSSS